jgi:hypothetical protein
MRRLLVLLAVLGASGSPAPAISYYFSPDVPTTLGGVTYMPWDIVRNDAGAYSLASSLPPGTSLDAIFRMNNGDWLLSVDAPVNLGGIDFDPRDVIRYNGVGYMSFFAGAAAGVPVTSDVDVAFLSGGDLGTLTLSFDVPTTIGGTTYDPADLVKYAGGVYSLSFDASATVPAIPTTVNVIGADSYQGLMLLSFDVPATLGLDFMPGQIASWNGAVFAPFYTDPSWPGGSLVNGLSLLADPGEVGATLTVAPGPPGTIVLSWTLGCSAVGAEDYGIYEGTIGTWYGHVSVDCNDAFPFFTEDIVYGAGNRYYLVVAKNPNGEGSYGRRSSGIERPVGGGACIAPQVLGSCP